MGHLGPRRRHHKRECGKTTSQFRVPGRFKHAGQQPNLFHQAVADRGEVDLTTCDRSQRFVAQSINGDHQAPAENFVCDGFPQVASGVNFGQCCGARTQVALDDLDVDGRKTQSRWHDQVTELSNLKRDSAQPLDRRRTK